MKTERIWRLVTLSSNPIIIHCYILSPPLLCKQFVSYSTLKNGGSMHESSRLQDSWEGKGLSVGVLAGVAVICAALAARFWRWE